MREEYFQLFIDEFGEADSCKKVPGDIIDKYRGKLPDQLLGYWHTEGWCQYANGLVWTVNPADYEDVVHAWIYETDLESIDQFYVIARSAFGNLYLCGEKIGQSITIISLTNSITGLAEELNEKSSDEKNKSIRHFFGVSDPDDYDMEDEEGEVLFERAIQKLGPLKDNEMYFFEPALVLGGRAKIENLQKGDIQVHLSILRKFSAPCIAIKELNVNDYLES